MHGIAPRGEARCNFYRLAISSGEVRHEKDPLTRVLALNLVSVFFLAASGGQGALCQPDNPPGSGTEAKVTQEKTMNSSTPDAVKLYRLTNKNGLEVDLLNLGATVVRLLVPDRHGKLNDVCLGFPTSTNIRRTFPLSAAPLAVMSNRIKNGKSTLDGKTYQLPVNDGPNCLHGGISGFSKRSGMPENIRFPADRRSAFQD